MPMASNTDTNFGDHTKVMGSWNRGPESTETQASLVAQTVKNPPAIQEIWVRSLGWEDPLEEEMATQSSTLAWTIPRTEDTGGVQFVGSQSWT